MDEDEICLVDSLKSKGYWSVGRLDRCGRESRSKLLIHLLYKNREDERNEATHGPADMS